MSLMLLGFWCLFRQEINSMMERCLARIEMSPQGGGGCARHAVAYASAQSLGTVPPRSTLSRANTIYGLVSLFMGIKRPLFATVQCGEPKGLEGGWGAPQEVVRLG